MESHPLEEYLALAMEAARRAGVVLEQWRNRFEIREKGRFDLVTNADHEAQEAIAELVRKRYPEHGFLGEESRQAPTLRPGATDQPLWIVDPLDGTTNYVHDCPVYAVSIGVEVAGELVVGVIYDPDRKELFSAAKGQGAWLNGRRLRTTRHERLEQALLSTGFPPDLRGQEHTLASWHHFSLRTQSLRRTGSTALNLAYVAAGRHDGFWTYQAHPWDAAGGVVLIREAGGAVTNLDGSDYDLYTLDLLASNGPLHPVLLENFQALPGLPT
jgi:myo-inositol-1(or 4)-monophosphatase